MDKMLVCTYGSEAWNITIDVVRGAHVKWDTW